MTSDGEVVGAILAGGLGRRMGEGAAGSGDKPLRRLGGRTLLDHVIARLQPQCSCVILNANDDPGRFAAFNLPVVPDTIPDRPGPLAGILAALDWAALHRPDVAWVASIAGDTPFLPSDYVARLVGEHAAAASRLAVASSAGRVHPVDGLWPVAIRDELRRAIVGGGARRVGDWVGEQGATVVEWLPDPLDPFFNVNTPADLAEAERLLLAVPAT